MDQIINQENTGSQLPQAGNKPPISRLVVFGIAMAVVLLVVCAGWAIVTITGLLPGQNKAAGYVEIKEAGLKFEADDDIKDLDYLVRQDNDHLTIGFSTKSLENFGSFCAAGQAPLGAITVWHQDPHVQGGREL